MVKEMLLPLSVVDQEGQQPFFAHQPTRRITDSIGLERHLHNHGFRIPERFGGKKGLAPVTCAAMLSCNSFSRVPTN